MKMESLKKEINMSGYAIAHGLCVNCNGVFSFNPHAVPSIRVRGVREPVCQPCMNKANTERVAKGLEPFPVREDAYEPIPEDEL